MRAGAGISVGVEWRADRAYNQDMARGWESKSVEDQIADAEARKGRPAPVALTADDLDRENRRQTLQLARSRTLQDLQQACNRRHRALLEQTLAHLDDELHKLQG